MKSLIKLHGTTETWECSSEPSIIELGSRIFLFKDQANFASFSGDCYPTHCDPEIARTTIIGECVAHGMNGVL